MFPEHEQCQAHLWRPQALLLSEDDEELPAYGNILEPK